MRVLVAYRQNQGPGKGWETGAALIRALRRLGHTAHPYGTTYQTNEWIAPRPPWTPDLIIFCECGDGDPQYTNIRTLFPGVPLVMWDFDTAIHIDRTRALIHDLNPELLFLANPDMIERFPGSKYLPYAADETRFKPTAGPKKGAAIIGSPFAERVEFARKVGVDVIQTETGQEYADAVAGLQVHVHHTNSGGDGLLVMRYWETLCCGTVLLCPDSASVRRHFEPNKHLLTYENEFDAGTKLKVCLSHLTRTDEFSPIRVAAAGRAHVLAHHTYRHRAQEIIDSL
jgi:hypothetical protein